MVKVKPLAYSAFGPCILGSEFFIHFAAKEVGAKRLIVEWKQIALKLPGWKNMRLDNKLKILIFTADVCALVTRMALHGARST
jgi:hypothetical protein